MREALLAIFGPERVLTDPDRLGEWAGDCTEAEGQVPAAVVFPRTTEEVQALVRAAVALGASVTPRVANQNVGGLAIAAPGGIVADLTGMDRVLEVDPENMVAVIEPGVTQQQLKDHLRERNLPLTFGFSLGPPQVSILANSLLDGLTNRSLKYGSMGQWISGLEVVLGDGSVVRTGAWALRGVAPFGRPPLPDLTGLFTAFQGTTGIATKMAFQLWPRHPREKRLFVLGYSSRGVFGAMQRLCRLEVCEDVGGLSWPNARMMMGVPRPDPVPDPGEPRYILYLDLAAEDEAAMALKERAVRGVLRALEREGERFERPLDVASLVRLHPGLGAFADFPVDLTFLTAPPGGGLTWVGTYGPIPRFAEAADAVGAMMVARGFPPATVSRAMWGGHYGVLRFLVTFAKDDPAEVARVRTLVRELLVALADRGFAMYKTPPWALELLQDRLDPGFRDLVRRVKALCDPHGVLNPGRWAV